MGRAILRALHLDSTAIQIAVWDGKASTRVAGAAADVAKWRSSGRESRVVPIERTSKPEINVSSKRDTPMQLRQERELCAFIFGDTVGFSQIPEQLLPNYRQAVFGTIAKVVAGFAGAVLAANSWGDAVYLVVKDALSGARCALEIQARLASIDFAAMGFSAPLTMRLSVHYGPAFPGKDELTHART